MLISIIDGWGKHETIAPFALNVYRIEDIDLPFTKQVYKGVRPVTEDPRVQELITLKTIAETMNQSNDMTLMLNTVLEKLLELTGLSTGWIFLTEKPGSSHVSPIFIFRPVCCMRTRSLCAAVLVGVWTVFGQVG